MMIGLSLLIACAVPGTCADSQRAPSWLTQAVSRASAQSSTNAPRTGARTAPATGPRPTVADGLWRKRLDAPGERLEKSRELARIDSRVRNRVENRIRNRIDEAYDALQGQDRPFASANEEAVQQRQRVTPR